jgi:hypothetical protein
MKRGGGVRADVGSDEQPVDDDVSSVLASASGASCLGVLVAEDLAEPLSGVFARVVLFPPCAPLCFAEVRVRVEERSGLGHGSTTVPPSRSASAAVNRSSPPNRATARLDRWTSGCSPRTRRMPTILKMRQRRRWVIVRAGLAPCGACCRGGSRCRGGLCLLRPTVCGGGLGLCRCCRISRSVLVRVCVRRVRIGRGWRYPYQETTVTGPVVGAAHRSDPRSHGRRQRTP